MYKNYFMEENVFKFVLFEIRYNLKVLFHLLFQNCCYEKVPINHILILLYLYKYSI